MLFYHSIELLPRPRFMAIAPSLAMVAVWALFEGTAPLLLGHPVEPLWLALVTYFALAFAARLPPLLVPGKLSPTARRVVIAGAALMALGIGAGGFAPGPWPLQIVWVLGWATCAGLFLLLLISSGPDQVASFPSRWASRHPFAREAMWIVALRLGTVVLTASLVAIHGTLTDWVLTISLGRLALFYLFEWVTVLCALTWRDRDS